jgi:Xaa-Pro dipeptidase
MEFDVLPVNYLAQFRQVFPHADFVDAAPLIRRVRMIKSRYEIHLMQDGARQVDKVCRHAREIIRQGMSDLELAAELERAARMEGHQGLVRLRQFNSELHYGLVVSGSDSAAPAFAESPLGGVGVSPAFGQGASYKPIDRFEPIIVDITGCCDGYFVGQSRVFALGGLSRRLVKGYEDMLRVQELMKTLMPQLPAWEELYVECLALVAGLGYGDNFMGTPGRQVSFIGRGLGVEMDEYPLLGRGFRRMTLKPGMAFTLEPLLVFPGEGAVGITNSFYLDDEGALHQLTFSSEELVILP